VRIAGRVCDPTRRLEKRDPRGFHILMPDRATADVYGEICFALRRKGKPIPENDIWIAALTLQHGRPLLTRDAHFREVEGLNVLGW
jgi:tRNA(fMet)-specific endonuclease VapC